MSPFPVATLGVILLTASVVAMISRRLRLPYSVGLVIGGVLLALLPLEVEIPLSRDLIFSIFLPPLVFEAALQLKWSAFRRDLPVTVLLAFPGVAIGAGVVAAGTHLLVGWDWIESCLFGILIAATDPVSVIAAFKEMTVEPRLSLLVESESLLNDGAAAVGFGVLLSIAAGTTGTPLAVAGSLVWTIAGGVGVGVGVSGLLLLLAWPTRDHLVEITLTTIAAYGSFLLAERFAMSGVLASLAAGLMVGTVGWAGTISEAGRGHILAFWDYAAFLVNSIVFILIGGHEAHQPISLFTGAAATAILLVLLGRSTAVYSLCAVLGPTRLRVDIRHQHVLFWGGLRGALALALALALPDGLPHRREIIVAAFAVVAFSIFAQGLTMPWLIRKLGLITADANPPAIS